MSVRRETPTTRRHEQQVRQTDQRVTAHWLVTPMTHARLPLSLSQLMKISVAIIGGGCGDGYSFEKHRLLCADAELTTLNNESDCSKVAPYYLTLSYGYA